MRAVDGVSVVCALKQHDFFRLAGLFVEPLAVINADGRVTRAVHEEKRRRGERMNDIDRLGFCKKWIAKPRQARVKTSETELHRFQSPPFPFNLFAGHGCADANNAVNIAELGLFNKRNRTTIRKS